MNHTQLTWAERGQLWLRLGIRAVLLCLAGLALIYLVFPLAELLSPFLFALVLAWALNPAARWLQRKLNISRKVISMVLILLVFSIIGGILFALGWVAVDQIRALFNNRQVLLEGLLGSVSSVSDSLRLWLEGFGDLVPDSVLSIGETITNSLVRWIQGLDLSGWLAQMAGQAPSFVSSVSGFVVALIVFMMASYFITGDYPRLRFLLTERVPGTARNFCRSVKDVFMDAFGGYIKSQLLLSMGVFVILTAGFLLMRQPYGLLLAFGLSVLDFIPIIGAGTVMVPWAVIDMILAQYGEAAALMAIWGVIVLFRRLAEPKILGNQTGLAPILSLVGIYVGMQLGGVLGMVVGPLLLLVFLNLAKLGIFQPVVDDINLAATDITAILRSGRRTNDPKKQD